MNEEEIFHKALSRSPEERAAYLEQVCAGDPALRASVEALLRANVGATGFLEQPAPALVATVVEQPVSEVPGAVIGAYRLLEQIGEGGFGVVFMADQIRPVRRKVALKVLKPGMDTRQVVARFEAERQALALMDHPNIAKVLDGGQTVSGRPYFVMELVKGTPITEFCDQSQLTPRRRLELFGSVCQAVQHAHHKGIIHRDLKPSNVLVSRHDTTPIVKVIDFGVAKALGQELTDKTLFTGIAQMIGTPLYMSPEQAGMSDLDIDTRSDIYSLGVLLYELLTGTTPFPKERFKQAGYDEIRRIIREEEPPRPSTRLSTLGQAAATVSANRRSDPRKLGQLMHGELDWIVMKALDKDRNRRYETASAFAADVQRHLADEPVLACPPSAGYRLRKLLRRHRGRVLAAAVVFLALVAGIAGLAVGLFQAEHQRQAAETARENERLEKLRAEQEKQIAQREKLRAEQEKQIAQAVRVFLQAKLLGQADPEQQADALRWAGDAAPLKENPTIRELLDRAAKELTPDKIEQQFPNQPLVQAAILQTIGEAYRGVGEYQKSIEHLRRARELCLRHLGPEHPDSVGALNDLGVTYTYAGQLTEAIAAHEEAYAKRLAMLGPDHPDTLTSLNNLAMTYEQAGKPDRAIPLYEQARDRRVAVLGADHPHTLLTLNNLAVAYHHAGKVTEATKLYKKVRDGWLAHLGPEHPLTLTAEQNLAEGYKDTGRLAEAIHLYQQVHQKQAKVLGADHPESLITLHNLARAYREDGQPLKSVELLEEIRPRMVKKLGADHPFTLTMLHNLAMAYESAGRLQDAIRLYEQVWDQRIARLGADHPESLTTLHNLAIAYWTAGKPPSVIIPMLEQVRDGRIAKLGADHRFTLDTLDNLARAYHAAGKLTLAIPLLEQVFLGRTAKLGAEHPDTLATMWSLARAYEDAGKLPEAIRLYEELRDKLFKAHGADDSQTLITVVRLAWAYRTAKRYPEAIQLYEQTIPKLKEKYGAEGLETLQTLNDLAVAYWSARQLDRSVPLFEELLPKYTAKLGANHPHTLIAMANLGINYRDAGRLSDAVALLEEALKRGKKLPAAGQAELAREMALDRELALTYDLAGQFAKSEPLYREIVDQARRQHGADHPQTAEALRQLGINLLCQEKAPQAEPVLRECLDILTRKAPDSPATSNAQWLLGRALLRQQKYAAAEPLLLAAWAWVKQHRADVPVSLQRACLESLVQLYDAWGKPQVASKWRKEWKAIKP
jgi:serine/threonine protein kinase/DNA-binding SARP family transcriptional activator